MIPLSDPQWAGIGVLVTIALFFLDKFLERQQGTGNDGKQIHSIPQHQMPELNPSFQSWQTDQPQKKENTRSESLLAFIVLVIYWVPLIFVYYVFHEILLRNELESFVGTMVITASFFIVLFYDNKATIRRAGFVTGIGATFISIIVRILEQHHIDFGFILMSASIFICLGFTGATIAKGWLVVVDAICEFLEI